MYFILQSLASVDILMQYTSKDEIALSGYLQGLFSTWVQMSKTNISLQPAEGNH